MKEEQRQRVLELLTHSPLEEEQEEREALEAPAVPLDAHLRDRLVAAVLRPEPRAAETFEGTPERATLKKDAPAARRRGRRWRVAGGIAAFAAAAAAVFVLRGALVAPVSEGEVPPYELQVRSSSQVLGETAAPAGPVHLVRDGMLRVDLRPFRAPQGEVVVRPYLWRGGQLLPWPVVLHRTELGVFRLSVPVSTLPEMQSGASEILFVVGPKGSLPSEAEVSRVARGGAPPAPSDWQLLRQAIVVEAQ
ncbi:MAG TPA: hypothetical protein VH877_30405 [Polyangia bacterium]|nr:hypothetical protein [Polyangia bacterium]